MAFHIVLVEPEIPANTGNISRTCAATGTYLHLVRPLGFQIDDKTLKRAGLDYWPSVKLEVHDSFAEVLEAYAEHRFFFATTKAKKRYTDFAFQDGDFFVFGRETRGLPEELLAEHPETLMRMPMSDAVRSLNLSNSAAIILYEGLRQTGFAGLT
ncbi:tRNA (uridine(34)/cytosine(34)/5-carboxymethylaminomethyluridine(34)-2'-O)-methyltransferase TrmL [Paenibacillus athensensis]|uniref:Putative tRNA (cytidine(34)-2'-O)-methyltransferase n=1 Tax=Paenibacillus athensensis TaxID=1967502 RepID=A0A4Y8Q318_9BACL|nr:tRNA (uridine(34)/cytosine(34)/5-carboxymethylaminomethyluridine(34)-2'-O)-methyltransferase TrmL [Paenibacillus athensensis]MCD1260982.1 tRNA (uridine(34)/cytosine(34)/5-carboxymethylaminomethyluridine(34)-2'-O)-methyltransferase TrmL [Paenibacillus athensensis]